MSPGRDLVIFDFDGTVAASWRDLATALNRTLREAGFATASGSEVRRWVGEGLPRLLQQALPADARRPERFEPIYAQLYHHYERCCLDTTTLYPGMAECLARLDRTDVLALLSNKPGRLLEHMAAELGVAGHFRAVVGGDALLVRKPDPALVRHVVQIVDFRPRQIWMIGDSALDVDTGRAAGAHTIGCTWGLRGRHELQTAGAEFLADHPSEIPALIARG
jgi:phosphoglycolate phosphatase